MEIEKHKILPKETTYDRIFAWFAEGEGYVVLTDKENEIRERWQHAWILLCNGRSTEQVVNFICKIHHPIGRSQVYIDVKNCKKLFGEVGRASKEGERHILKEMGHKILQLAIRKGDLKAAAAQHMNLIKLGGLDNNDADLPDFSKLEQHFFTLNIPPEAMHLLKTMMNKGAVNLSEIRNEVAKTIETDHTTLDESGEKPNEGNNF